MNEGMMAVYLLSGVGLFFMGLGVFSLHRFPDVYTRLHGTTKCTTFGSIFLYGGIVLYAWLYAIPSRPVAVNFAMHVAIVLVLLLLTSSTGAHAIARAAHKSGTLPKKAIVDSYESGKGVGR